MRRFNIVSTVSCVALVALSLQSCDRTNGIVNNQVITKPYSLHFVDTLGNIYYTNDGDKFGSLHITDGVAGAAIFGSGSNILFIKENSTILFASDGGEGSNTNFNPVFKQLNPAAYPTTAVINLEDFVDTGGLRDRIYAATNTGLVFNDSNGKSGTPWFAESNVPGQNIPVFNIGSATSLVQLANKTVVVYNASGNIIYTKENINAHWTPKNVSGLNPDGQSFMIAKGDELIVVCYDGNDAGKMWRSTDLGNNFNQLPEILTGEPAPLDKITDITAVDGVFGKVLIACTRDNGIWRLSKQNTWEESTFGLEEGTRVYDIVSKTNLFKNEAIREYVYIATSTGVYRSDDLGQNWIRVFEDNVFTAID